MPFLHSSREIPSVKEAYAVDGTPADTVMLALHSPLYRAADKGDFDLVVSCGMDLL
jgi:broad specificity polyphosphatase/5'/3'-nucleotidase SurE